MVQATRTVVFSRGQQLRVKSPNVGNILVGNRWCYFWESGDGTAFHEDDYRSGEKYRRMINRLGEGRSLGNSVSFSDRASYARLGNVFFG